MQDQLKAGLRTSRRIVVDNERAVRFMGEQLRVYATPSLIRDIEVTCQDYLQKFTHAGEQSVGIQVNISHLGATPMGTPVEIEVVVTKVDGRKVFFDVTARDPVEEIARGEHTRFVVNVDKLGAKVREKVAKLSVKAKTAKN